MTRLDMQAAALADDPRNDALLACLELAVPWLILELRQLTPYARAEQVRVWAAFAADVIGSNGDQLMFRTRPRKLRELELTENSRRKAGDETGTANTFNWLAKGLAALAMLPGGVLFAGQHWCVEHPWGKRCTSITELGCGASGLDTDQATTMTTPPAVITVTTTEVL